MLDLSFAHQQTMDLQLEPMLVQLRVGTADVAVPERILLVFLDDDPVSWRQRT